VFIVHFAYNSVFAVGVYVLPSTLFVSFSSVYHPLNVYPVLSGLGISTLPSCHFAYNLTVAPFALARFVTLTLFS